MKLKYLLCFFYVLFFSCSEDNDVKTPRNLEEYIDINSNRQLDNVIACAANEDGNLSLTYIFYYPINGAKEIKYFETEDINVEKNDFSNYRRKILPEVDIFGGKLKRFSRSGSDEVWCIISYVTNGKLHLSEPIRLKNTTSPTIWKDEVIIQYPATLEPKFTWSDFGIADNAIYFQVLSDEDDDFISGIYTRENFFQYYDTSNTDENLVINTTIPAGLILGDTYNFTLMAVNEYNWVNLVIQKSFVAE